MSKVCEETFWPRFKNADQVASLQVYFRQFNSNQIEGKDFIDSLIKHTKIQSKVLLFDAMLIRFKTVCPGVRNQNMDSMNLLCLALRDLNCDKFRNQGAGLPNFLKPLLMFNDPYRTKHKAERVRQETLLNYMSPITSLLEKSYTQLSSFSELHTVIDNLVEACVKYSDYLSANLQSVNEYHELEENENASEVFSLPVCEGSWRSQYTIQREQYSMEYILEKLEFTDYYEPVFLGNIIPAHKAHRYAFIKKLKTLGLEVPGVVLFCHHYGPANGNIYLIWKEGIKEYLTLRQNLIDRVVGELPKYFSRSHKQRVKVLTNLIMQDKISTAQFRALYRELTGDESVADNAVSKSVDERTRLILKNADASIIRDISVNNGRKEAFDTFWEVTENKLEELQAAAVDDRHHATETDREVVLNMALALSARDLYQQCVDQAKKENLLDEQIPSLSWFRFQFWPKNIYTHTAVNYTGRLKIHYIIQQRSIRKYTPDDHYCSALYKYCRELAVQFAKHVTFFKYR